MYRLHSMHGPTVFTYNSLTKALEKLDSLKLSNGGVYRIMRDGSERIIASLDTYATTTILNAEHNQTRRDIQGYEDTLKESRKNA